MAIDCTQTHLNKLCPTQHYAQATGVGPFANYLDIQCQKKREKKKKISTCSLGSFYQREKST